MTAPFVLPSLLLALALAISAVFKLRDPSTTDDAFVSLRLPRWMRTMHLPRVLPITELLLALGLIVVPSPACAVVTTLTALLFLAYLVVIVRALAFDEPVVCGCFGKLGLGEVDTRTAVRNVIFVVLALVALADSFAGHGVVSRLTHFSAAQWMWLIGVVVAISLTGLVMWHPNKSVEPDPLAAPQTAVGDDAELDYVRQPIPYGVLRDRDSSELKTLAELASERAVLLTFLSSSCGSCVRVMEMLPAWVQKNAILHTVAVPVLGGSDEFPELGIGITRMDDPDGIVMRTFGTGFPSAVLLGMDGMVAGGPVTGTDEVRQFLADIDEQLSEAEATLDAEAVDTQPSAAPG